MKKFILFFALFAMCLGVKAQWENIRNAGSQIYYTDIQFCNINTGYVVGYDGSETWVNKGIVEKTEVLVEGYHPEFNSTFRPVHILLENGSYQEFLQLGL